MNKLVSIDEDAWVLPSHAHVIVHETADGGEFITIYDCGAVQRPPSAQLIGNLVRIDAEHELRTQPTGYIVSLREPSRLIRQDADHWLIRRTNDDPYTD